jgi:hypothetical protein
MSLHEFGGSGPVPEEGGQKEERRPEQEPLPRSEELGRPDVIAHEKSKAEEDEEPRYQSESEFLSRDMGYHRHRKGQACHHNKNVDVRATAEFCGKTEEEHDEEQRPQKPESRGRVLKESPVLGYCRQVTVHNGRDDGPDKKRDQQMFGSRAQSDFKGIPEGHKSGHAHEQRHVEAVNVPENKIRIIILRRKLYAVPQHDKKDRDPFNYIYIFYSHLFADEMSAADVRSIR